MRRVFQELEFLDDVVCDKYFFDNNRKEFARITSRTKSPLIRYFQCYFNYRFVQTIIFLIYFLCQKLNIKYKSSCIDFKLKLKTKIHSSFLHLCIFFSIILDMMVLWVLRVSLFVSFSGPSPSDVWSLVVCTQTKVLKRKFFSWSRLWNAQLNNSPEDQRSPAPCQVIVVRETDFSLRLWLNLIIAI